jgi:hypothetical protein
MMAGLPSSPLINGLYPDYAARRSALLGQFSVLLYYTTRTSFSRGGIFLLGVLTLSTSQVCLAAWNTPNLPDQPTEFYD